MNVEKIIAQLRSERNRLVALEGLNGTGKRRGRPLGSTNAPRKRRRMSAAARRRISAGMKARWAARKKQAKTA